MPVLHDIIWYLINVWHILYFGLQSLVGLVCCYATWFALWRVFGHSSLGHHNLHALVFSLITSHDT